MVVGDYSLSHVSCSLWPPWTGERPTRFLCLLWFPAILGWLPFLLRGLFLTQRLNFQIFQWLPISCFCRQSLLTLSYQGKGICDGSLVPIKHEMIENQVCFLNVCLFKDQINQELYTQLKGQHVFEIWTCEFNIHLLAIFHLVRVHELFVTELRLALDEVSGGYSLEVRGLLISGLFFLQRTAPGA